MARITTVKPRVTVPAMRLAAPKDEAGRSRYRDNNAPWRAWYKTARWQRLRWQVLTDAMFTCAMCGRLEGDTSKLVADHIIPHRGDEVRFWDETQIQCLCKSCHDGAKQREERRQGFT